MMDPIDRQAAIDAIGGAKVDEGWCTEYDIGYNDGIAFAVSKLSVLPSVQSEPKQKEGTWMGGDLGYLTCCGVDGCASDMWNFCEDDNKCFCPNCGARITKFISYWNEGYMKKEEWLKTKEVSTEECEKRREANADVKGKG